MSKFKYVKRFLAATGVGATAGAVVGFEGSPFGLKRQAAKDGAVSGALVGATLGLPYKPMLNALRKVSKTYAAGASITPGSTVGSAVRGYKGAVRFIRRHGRIIPIRAK